MITKAYTRSVPLSATIASSAREIFAALLSRQATIVDVDYNRRTSPHLADELSSLTAVITQSDNAVDISVAYPIVTRYLDFKKTYAGKKKRYYTPTYNRPLFGHLYGRGYSLSNLINAALGAEYQNYHQNLKNLEIPIEL